MIVSDEQVAAQRDANARMRTSAFRLRVVPLGTSAGRPTVSRGASALAIAAEGAWVLCDRGEGAQVAALRAGFSLSRLDAVLVTHLHGDHFNGLPGLLGTLGLEGRERPLTVAGPRGILSLLEALARAGSLGTGALPVRIVELDGDGGVVELPAEETGFRVVARPLAHRVPTYGYRVSLPDRPGTLDVEAAVAAGIPRGPLLSEVKEGRTVVLPDGRRIEGAQFLGPSRRGPSVAYALDTTPCQDAVELGRGADVLVHESTYEHARAELAHSRGHSTGVEAGRVAAEARAGTLLLTHFSPSVDAARVADEAREIHPLVTAAADLDGFDVPAPS
ncbi:MAG TPA: ribonuclease Z [Myxococcales bacterium]|nr:ribonuclease Z [Myxococcales bacterium]